MGVNPVFKNLPVPELAVLLQRFYGGMEMKRARNDKSCPKSAIKAADMKLMFSSGVLSPKNPSGLLKMACFLRGGWGFCRRGREGLQKLKKDVSSSRQIAPARSTLQFNEATKNHPGGLLHDFEGEKRMYAQPESQVCPVATLKLYLSKLNPKQDAFLQRPYSSKVDETHA